MALLGAVPDLPERFPMEGTAYGEIATSKLSLHTPSPPNGMIFDVMSDHGVSWRNYFSDVPSTLIIPEAFKEHIANVRPLAEFAHDCRVAPARRQPGRPWDRPHHGRGQVPCGASVPEAPRRPARGNRLQRGATPRRRSPMVSAGPTT